MTRYYVDPIFPPCPGEQKRRGGGGLLVALPREDAEPLLRELQTFAPWSAIVGEVSELRATALEFD